MILSGAFHIISLLPASFHELIDKFDMSIVWAFSAIIAIVIIVFIWNLSLSPCRIYKEQQLAIVDKDRRIAKLEQELAEVQRQNSDGDMSDSEVLEYALKNSNLTTKYEIETALRKAALRKHNPITVFVQPSGDSIWRPVPQDIFETHAIRLSKDDTGHVFNFRNSEAEPYGMAPYFWRDQIERLWKDSS